MNDSQEKVVYQNSQKLWNPADFSRTRQNSVPPGRHPPSSKANGINEHAHARFSIIRFSTPFRKGSESMKIRPGRSRSRYIRHLPRLQREQVRPFAEGHQNVPSSKTLHGNVCRAEMRWWSPVRTGTVHATSHEGVAPRSVITTELRLDARGSRRESRRTCS